MATVTIGTPAFRNPDYNPSAPDGDNATNQDRLARANQAQTLGSPQAEQTVSDTVEEKNPALSVLTVRSTVRFSGTSQDESDHKEDVERAPSPQAEASISSTLGLTKKMHWVSRRMMVGCFVLGLGGVLGHHGFYTALAGHSISSRLDQERTRLLGNALAYFVQASLVISIDVAFTSWLFWCLFTRPVTVKCLDAAYSATSSLLFLFNKEMYRILPDVAVLALFIAVLTIPTTMITPGTLSVEQSLTNVTNNANVSVPAIFSSDFEQTTYYHYSRQKDDPYAADNYTLVFESPRTILWRILTAAAANGEVLNIPAPAVNASYQLQFSGPYVTCEEADAGAIAIMKEIMARPLADASDGLLVETAYYAYVPDLSPDRYGQPNQRDSDISRSSNQLWMAFKTNRTDGTGWDTEVYPKCHDTSYRICSLQNATYRTTLTFENGQQHIAYNVTDLTPVTYPPATVDSRKPEEVSKLSFASYFWAFSDLLTGSMALHADDPKNKSGRWYSAIDTKLQNTALLGSRDLNCFFAYGWMYYRTTYRAPSNQRLQDIMFARNNAPLDLLIPELSANLTFSLMSNNRLSPGVLTAVDVTTSVPVYSYNSQTLLISYSMALLATLIANAMGWAAFKRNKVCMDKSFTVTAIATRHIEDLLEPAHYSRRGSVHIPKGVRDKYVMFRQLKQPPEGPGGWGFEVVSLHDVNREAKGGLLKRMLRFQRLLKDR